MAKLRKAKTEAPPNEKPAAVKTHLRDMVVVPEMIGSVVGIYNGKIFNTVEIKPEMTGHYLGEFSISYVPPSTPSSCSTGDWLTLYEETRQAWSSGDWCYPFVKIYSIEIEYVVGRVIWHSGNSYFPYYENQSTFWFPWSQRTFDSGRTEIAFETVVDSRGLMKIWRQRLANKLTS